MADQEDIMLMLGEIRGELKGMNKKLDSIDGIDERLRQNEVKASKNGAAAGGFMGIGIAIISEGVRHAFK